MEERYLKSCFPLFLIVIDRSAQSPGLKFVILNITFSGDVAISISWTSDAAKVLVIDGENIRVKTNILITVNCFFSPPCSSPI